MQHNNRPPFHLLASARMSRREVLRSGFAFSALAALQAMFSPATAIAKTLKETSALSTLTFKEIEKQDTEVDTIAPGYRADILLRWGDPILKDAPEFDPAAQTVATQAQQFGYNNDFIAFMPLTAGNSSHGLICVNHEYTIAQLMFNDVGDTGGATSKDEIAIEMAAQGVSIAEIEWRDNRWQIITDGKYNRRITANTLINISGPAAGHARLKTADDATGTKILGTFANCSGGVTPWGTVLTCEENFDTYFNNAAPDDHPESQNHKIYGIGKKRLYNWHTAQSRFDAAKEPNEPNRFGWVVEYAPFNAESTPVKRTALGRFKHETATVVHAPDGRIVIYSGDDEKFQYLYRFVSARTYKKNGDNNNLLDEGTLYAARFDEHGTLTWLPLVYGNGPLTERNSFHSQADVLIETRRAADLMGATPMDRPEGISIPKNGKIYVVLTHNENRIKTDAANPRAHNIHGHIVELTPPSGNHAADKFTWDIFLKAGNPASESDYAMYRHAPSANGWLSCPDNITSDPAGNVWIATDGQPESIGKNDGLYAAATSGATAGAPRLFFTGPKDCEITGPCFTPDGKTLFLSIQHPGEKSTYDDPSTRWPDFDENIPPRPAVLAITRIDGGLVGS